MINISLARRYAQALFDIGSERGCIDKYAADLDLVSSTLSENKELAEAIYGQMLTVSAKKEIIRSVFAGHVDDITLNFLFVVLQKSRESYIEEMRKAFLQLIDEKNNVREAEVQVAAPLSAEQEAELQKSLSQLTGQNIRLSVQVNKEIRGGVVAKVGDRVYDGSVTTKLKALKEQLGR